MMEVKSIEKIDADTVCVTYNEKRLMTKTQLERKKEQLEGSQTEIEEMLTLLEAP